MPVRSGFLYRSRFGALFDSPMFAMSSGRCSFSGLLGPFGWRDTASAALCLTPGMCTILNLYRRVFSLRLRSRALEISSRERSLNNLRRGLWSMAIIRFSQPRVKYHALSRASTTARASPSTGAYRVSAAWVK